MGRFVYRVRCTFTDAAVADRWVDWLKRTHLDEVVEAGAESAEVLQLDGDAVCFEAVYRFKDRAAFERYEAEHAPRLRQDGLERFPLALGLTYMRTTGTIVS